MPFRAFTRRHADSIPTRLVLACLCFFLSGLLQPVLAEDQSSKPYDKRNRVEKVFPLGEVVLADNPLPDKVFQRRRYTFQIFVLIHKRGDTKTVYATSSGSASAYPSNKAGIIVSSAHVIQQPIFRFTKMAAGNSLIPPGRDFQQPQRKSIISIIGGDDEEFKKFTYAELNKKLSDMDCEFSVFARSYSTVRFTELVPLKIVAITEPENPVDVVVLQLANIASITQQALLPPEAMEKINPYSAFITPAEIGPKANAGDTVYITGFGIMQPFVEEVIVAARIDNTKYAPALYEGLSGPYSIRGIPVPGFSGGPVLNSDGQMIGIVKGGDGKFTLVISVEDINNVMRKAKLAK